MANFPPPSLATSTKLGLVKGVGIAADGSLPSGISADVVVYGATFGGIMAAAAAIKQGATAIIIEPRNDIGGLVTGGVQATDSQWSAPQLRATISGMTSDFYAALASEYGLGQQQYYVNGYYAESKRARIYLQRLIQKYGIRIYINAKLTAVVKTGTVITSATFDTIGTVTGSQFIDTTYVGDLMAMAGCSFVVGRESAATYSEAALNTGTFVNTGSQPVNPVDPYITPGVPGSGLIAFVQPGTLNATGTAEPTVQAMGFRLSVTTDAANKITFPLPAAYDSTKYEILRRHAAANGSGWTSITDVFLVAPALPGDWPNKRDINHKQVMSLDYIHPESTEYVTASWARRAVIDENIKQYTLGLLYFLQNDTSVPASVRASVSSYGLTADEYQDNGGWPKYPYCREARRMVGDFVLKGTDITALNTFVDPIAQAYYNIDCHQCQYLASAGKLVIEGQGNGTVNAATGARIPRRIMHPKVTECTNLLVTWCASVSHAAFCGIRLEPNAGNIGEAAGVIAALAAAKGISVQSVTNADMMRYVDIFGWQNYGGATVSSDTAATYADGSIVTTGTWAQSTSAIFGTVAVSSCSTTSAVNSQQVRPSLKETGLHDVYLKWSDNSSNPTRGSPTITVTALGVSAATFTVSQSMVGGDGGDWYYAGRYFFKKGDGVNNNVTITHDNTANASNWAGMKFIPARNNPLMKKAL